MPPGAAPPDSQLHGLSLHALLPVAAGLMVIAPARGSSGVAKAVRDHASHPRTPTRPFHFTDTGTADGYHAGTEAGLTRGSSGRSGRPDSFVIGRQDAHRIGHGGAGRIELTPSRCPGPSQATRSEDG